MQFSPSFSRKKKSAVQPLFHSAKRGALSILPVVLFIITLLPGCSKQQPEVPTKDTVIATESNDLVSDDQFMDAYQANAQSEGNALRKRNGCSFTTFLELLEARAATAKYRDFDRAIADSFVDINVVVPNMGYHFMKSAIVDAKFEIRKPEILVYNKKLNGKFELVAVEYAVPISLSPDKAPEGFTGSADVWERNTTFGLWLQHAWIWKFNPDGVFTDTNPRVHVH